MTRIDFYLLADSDEIARQRFASRWAHRAVSEGKRVHMRVDRDLAEALDDLLWDYPPEQFLPHALLADANGEPVTVGTPDEAPPHRELLLNLHSDIAPDFQRFERVAEVILAPERAAARGKYRTYRDRGYPLFHHELDDWE